MNMVGVIFGAEFERRIWSRTYIVGTVIGAAAIAFIAVLPSLLSGFSNPGKAIVLVGDPQLTAAAADALKRDFTVVAREPRLMGTPTTAYLDHHHKAATVAVINRHGNTLHVVAYTRDPGELRSTFAQDLSVMQLQLATGMSEQRLKRLMTVAIDERDVGGKFTDAMQATAAKGIAYVFVLLLYLSILLNAQSISMSVAEEKTSRIAELLVATIDPAQLLFAKVLAASATGFIQLGIWIATAVVTSGAIASTFAEPSAYAGTFSTTSTASVIGVTAPEVVWFVVFFLVGFAQFAVLFAAAASLVNRTEDVGSISGPLYLPIVGAMIIAQFAVLFPNATNVVTFSFIPLLSPFVMFTRVVVANVPLWQLVVSLVINVAGAIVLAWVAGRVYRIGMIMYGKPPTLRQVLAAIRA